MTLLIGSIIGLVLGLTGAGGSVFAVPLFIIVLELSVSQAIALSLGVVSASALFGVVARLKSNDIQWVLAAIYAAIGSLFAPMGSILNKALPEDLILMAFSLLVIVVATRMWRQASRNPQLASEVRAGVKGASGEPLTFANIKNRRCLVGIVAGATVTGLLSGLFGVGGGFLIVPLLIFLTEVPIKQAVATSLVVIAAVSSSGFISFLWSGASVSLDLLIPVALGGFLGMLFGIFLSRYIAGPALQKIFSLLMLLMAGFTFYYQSSL